MPENIDNGSFKPSDFKIEKVAESLSHIEGLADERKIENVQIMEALPGKYPHAFSQCIDKNNIPYLVLRDSYTSPGWANKFDETVTTISENGVTTFNSLADQFLDAREGTVILTPIENDKKHATISKLGGNDFSRKAEVVSQTDFRNFEYKDFKDLKEKFQKAEKYHLEYDSKPETQAVHIQKMIDLL
jgi:hypothetical protein